MSGDRGRGYLAETSWVTPEQWSRSVTPIAAALATLCASTALGGIIDGMRWLGYIGIAVIVVMVTGIGLRTTKTPTLVVGLVQILVVLWLSILLFTNSLVPSPAGFGELGGVLGKSVDVVRTSVPPVAATPPLLCLVVLAIGMVAVLVDTLSVAAGAPAASGLVLLCVYAVPASLSDGLLPAWSFILGAAAFALLLWVDGTHRHQLWRNRTSVSGTGSVHGAGTPTVLVGVALVLGLLAGVTITAIGTVGQLPGAGGKGPGGSGGLGLNPMAQLRGMLDQRGNTELFRVRGLPDQRYLRAITLNDFKDGIWQPIRVMQSGVAVSNEQLLPNPPGYSGIGPITPIDIEPINSEDNWVPVYGTPRRLRDLPEGVRYDWLGGMAYTQTRRKMPRYIEEADLAQPSATDLRAANSNDYHEIDPIYTQLNTKVDPQVEALARDLTVRGATNYDKAWLIWNFFRDKSNGFVYDTKTAPPATSDALSDFLFRGKAGFCEQFASAMAVLLRAAHIPSRVSIGYTAGFQQGDYRTITSSDAHAWVEVYFPRRGWVTFDPTPLSDGRAYTPPYMTSDQSTSAPTSTAQQTNTAPTSTGAETTRRDKDDLDQTGAIQQGGQTGLAAVKWTSWAMLGGLVLLSALATWVAVLGARRRRAIREAARSGRSMPDSWMDLQYAAPIAAGLWILTLMITAGVLVSWWVAVLILVLCLAAAPSVARMWQRHTRMHAVHARNAGAADAGWQELLAESWDRGVESPNSDTVRTAARRLAVEHKLDEDGRTGLRTVVGVVERSWYGGSDASSDPALGEAVDQVRGSMRRNAPLGWRARLLPRSVLHPPRPKRDPLENGD